MKHGSLAMTRKVIWKNQIRIDSVKQMGLLEMMSFRLS